VIVTSITWIECNDIMFFPIFLLTWPLRHELNVWANLPVGSTHAAFSFRSAPSQTPAQKLIWLRRCDPQWVDGNRCRYDVIIWIWHMASPQQDAEKLLTILVGCYICYCSIFLGDAIHVIVKAYVPWWKDVLDEAILGDGNHQSVTVFFLMACFSGFPCNSHDLRHGP
jgi:hypothetical protein